MFIKFLLCMVFCFVDNRTIDHAVTWYIVILLLLAL